MAVFASGRVMGMLLLGDFIIATVGPVVANSSTSMPATAAWRALEEVWDGGDGGEDDLDSGNDWGSGGDLDSGVDLDSGDSGVAGPGQMCIGNADPGPYALDNYICLFGTLKPNANAIHGADDATCCIVPECPYPERCLAGGGCMEGTAGIGCATCAPGKRLVGISSEPINRKNFQMCVLTKSYPMPLARVVPGRRWLRHMWLRQRPGCHFDCSNRCTYFDYQSDLGFVLCSRCS